MSAQPDDILILGGGLAGVTAAYELARQGKTVRLVEREPEVGGLAKSLVYHSKHGDFSYDIGPHRFHSDDKRVHDVTLKVLGENKVERIRMSRILLYGKFFDYPLKLKKALFQLPKPVMLRAIWDYYVQVMKNLFTTPDESNFEAWVVKRFGRKLYEVFFGVYTEKTWGVPCDKISADWASQRISQASLWDAVKKSIFRPKGEVRSLVSKFNYPRTGGIGEIARSFAREAEKLGAKVHRGTEVEAVIVEDGTAVGARVRHADGTVETLRAGTVLNTMPITRVTKMLEPAAPPEVIAAVDSLQHRSMVFVYLILDREQVSPDHWVYIPEAKLTVHRISEFKNFSEECAPAGKTLVCAEITCDLGDEVWNKGDEELRRIATSDLEYMGLIKADEVLETFTHREVYAYPLYTLTYREPLAKIIGHLDGIENLDTTGRQGLFKYNNMDHSIAMGLGAADNILGRGEDHRKVATGDVYFG
ncbi:MAG: FAD-dependent oxidoreductase [Planctomycetota bacterium]